MNYNLLICPVKVRLYSQIVWILEVLKGCSICDCSRGGHILPIADFELGRAMENVFINWSPDGSQLSVAGGWGSNTGLWIYNMEAREASKVLSGKITRGRWSPDRSRMVSTDHAGVVAVNAIVLIMAAKLDLEH